MSDDAELSAAGERALAHPPDAERFRPENDGAVMRSLVGGPDDVVFLSVGRLQRRKGPDMVLKALAPNPESRYQSAVSFASELRASLAVLDALDVAGEEEELVQKQSTSVGRVAVMSAVMSLIALALAWWFMRS